jgi:hypothetical protein
MLKEFLCDRSASQRNLLIADDFPPMTEKTTVWQGEGDRGVDQHIGADVESPAPFLLCLPPVTPAAAASDPTGGKRP